MMLIAAHDGRTSAVRALLQVEVAASLRMAQALKLSLVAAAVGLSSAFAPPMSVRPASALRAAVSMDEKEAPKKAKKEKAEPKPRAPGEGDPFGAIAQAYSEANKDGLSAYQPRGISDATVIDKGQIVFAGTIAALKANDDVRQRYLAL